MEIAQYNNNYDGATKERADTTIDAGNVESQFSKLHIASDEANDNSRSYAYGLVVYKSQKLNKYLRVGIFSSSPGPQRGGGMEYFRAGQIQTISIV
jgi:hypothetical protein